MNPTRYGIYLRPDPLTCWIQGQVNVALRQQYGLVSAGNFPPHATLVGNLRTTAPVGRLVELIESALRGRTSFTVFNKGLRPLKNGYVFDIHETPTGAPNEEFVRLATAVTEAVLPVALPTDDYLVTSVADSIFRGHLSLASHDLAVDSTLSREVGEFLAGLLTGLPSKAPQSFPGNTVVLYGTDSDDWHGHWWKTHRYTHIRSWMLPDAIDVQ